MRGRVDHGISPQAVSFRLVLESEAAEGSEAGNDCVGSEVESSSKQPLKPNTVAMQRAIAKTTARIEAIDFFIFILLIFKILNKMIIIKNALRKAQRTVKMYDFALPQRN